MVIPNYLRRLVKRALIKRFPLFLMAYRYAKENQRIFDNLKETPMGFRLIGHNLMESGDFEPDETEIVKKILKKIEIFINVGANIGYYCCIAMQDRKSVIAFEPIESNLHYLYKNLKANKWEENIEIYPLALSDRTGFIEIYGSGTGASLIKGWAGQSEDYLRFVPTSTLDKILGSRLSGRRCFILVDIEGSEEYMLKGASSFLLMNPKPIWLVEIAISEHQPEGTAINPNILSTFNIFWENGYDAWTADKNIRLVARSEIETILNGGTDTFNTHNFLFIEKHKNLELFEA